MYTASSYLPVHVVRPAFKLFDGTYSFSFTHPSALLKARSTSGYQRVDSFTKQFFSVVVQNRGVRETNEIVDERTDICPVLSFPVYWLINYEQFTNNVSVKSKRRKF